MTATLVHTFIHIILLLAMPPLLLGVIVKTKAAFAGRIGAPVLQSYFDLFKLMRKGAVLSQTTTWVFIAGPVITAVAAVLAGLLVPLGGRPAPVHFTGDIFLFVSLLALGRFFTAAAALDTGSAFEGMGAAREVTFACIAEPAMLFALLALARLSGSYQLSGLFGDRLTDAWVSAGPTMVMILVGLFLVVLVENCRIPFDDPNTHLELTMIHEVMVLDHGGPALGVVLYGASVKLFVLGAMVARIGAPASTGNLLADWGFFVVAMLAVAVAIGVVESVMARLRLIHIPTLLIGACLLTAFGFVLLLR
jgi:formate hydrogenlyase subunit 4